MRLADLARAACVSRFHFARLFRQSTGQSPMRYVARYRVERAKRLLAEGGRHISDIAVETGFFDQSHLTRVFRRVVGVTPARFARASD
jgi:AraC-like DNA-binding protein